LKTIRFCSKYGPVTRVANGQQYQAFILIEHTTDSVADIPDKLSRGPADPLKLSGTSVSLLTGH